MRVNECTDQDEDEVTKTAEEMGGGALKGRERERERGRERVRCLDEVTEGAVKNI